MKIRTERIFDDVSQELIENAKVEIETEKIIKKAGLRNEETGYLIEACYDFFKKNHKDNLTVYKQNKHSGYSSIVLYKGVARVGSGDFMTKHGQEMEEELSISQDWPVYQLHALKRKVLCNLFDDPWDHRRGQNFKPSIDKIWEILEKCIVA